eukprot:15334570-Ditylum_brightwellii.AAC.1
MARRLTTSIHAKWQYRSTTTMLLLFLMAFMGNQIGLNRNLQLPQHLQQQIEMHENDISATDDTTLHQLAQIASTARSNSINEKELPYRCGVVFFYHIPCTGRTTINNYLTEQSTQRNGASEYFTYWGVPDKKKTASLKEQRENLQRQFINGMDKLVRNISMDEWRIAHAHHNSFHLNESESILSNWRSIVESNGCHFVASVMFRDALIHLLALHKVQRTTNTSREEFIDYLNTTSQLSLYNLETQLDNFLYNKITRNPHDVDAQVKVDRALQLLARHFDIVA